MKDGKVTVLAFLVGAVAAICLLFVRNNFISEIQSGDKPQATAVSAVQTATPEQSGSDSVYNIVLMGTDERADEFSDDARADCVLMLSIDFENKTTRLVSFERGIGVPILEGAYQGQYDWLTHCFRYGGATLVVRELAECFSLDVSDYVRANFDSLTKIVDEVGGIDIELTQAEAEYINRKLAEDGTTGKTVQTGANQLDGEEALIYARCREIDDDWHRVERQRKIVLACADKIWQMDEDSRDAAALRILAEVKTNIDSADLQDLMDRADEFAGADMEQLTIPTDGTYTTMTGLEGRNMYSLDFEANAEALNEFLYRGNTGAKASGS